MERKIIRDNKGRFMKGTIVGGMKGKTPWNKGLRKETDERVRKNGGGVSQSRQKGIKDGTIIVWNKGLNIKDPRIKKNCEANQKWREENIKGKTYEEIFGRDKAEKIKQIQRINNSLAKKGEKNPMFGRTEDQSPRWLGGKSFEPYDLNWNNKFKRAIRKRDNQICMLCGTHREKLSRALSVHHINYDKKLTIPQNCISLCIKCHGLTQINREHYTKFFQDILAKYYGYQYNKGDIILDIQV